VTGINWKSDRLTRKATGKATELKSYAGKATGIEKLLKSD